AVSLAPGRILDQIRQVVENGFREIVITGVNIGRYRYGDTDFEGLLEMILRVSGDFRVRISSLEPDGFSSDFHRLFDHPKLAPHLHLCLQSGSDPILLRMRRMYTVTSFMEILGKFRKNDPDFNFTTDIIVGFPGETEEDFNRTVEVAREAMFSHIHTFRYSRRKGTRADRMENQVPERVKAERSELIRNISWKNRIRYMEQMAGKEQRVLVESTGPGGNSSGYGENYLPVNFSWPGTERNRFRDVILDSIEHSDPPVMTALPRV
ncbi:MAG: radical SAM protein, partial [Bacteroidetes bacterium]